MYMQQFLNQLKQAKFSESREPWIPVGTHELLLKDFVVFQSPTKGPAIKAVFLTDKTDNPELKPGGLVSKMYTPCQPPRFPGDNITQQQEMDRALTLVGRLFDAKTPDDAKQYMEKLLSPDGQALQPARGMRIRATASLIQKRPTPQSPNPKPWVDITWDHVAGQNPETIKAGRSQVETAIAQAPAPSQPAWGQSGVAGQAPSPWSQPAAAPAPQPAVNPWTQPAAAPTPAAAPAPASTANFLSQFGVK